jgi:magnesium-transporting ATPase (P-type)
MVAAPPKKGRLFFVAARGTCAVGVLAKRYDMPAHAKLPTMSEIHKACEVLLRQVCCSSVTQTKGNTGTKHGSVEELVEKADGFAEVFPEHKFEIVEILQVFDFRC